MIKINNDNNNNYLLLSMDLRGAYVLRGAFQCPSYAMLIIQSHQSSSEEMVTDHSQLLRGKSHRLLLSEFMPVSCMYVSHFSP